MNPAEDLTQALIALATNGQRPRCGDPVTRDLWTSADREERELAASWCTGCPGLVLCHEAAEAGRESFGVWGGVDRSPNLGRLRPGGKGQRAYDAAPLVRGKKPCTDLRLPAEGPESVSNILLTRTSVEAEAS